MCTGAEVAVLAGTTAKTVGDQQTRRAQLAEAERGARLAREVNNRAGARVSEEVQRLKASDDTGEEQALQNDFMEALRRNQIDGGGGLDAGPGAVSEAFREDTADTRRAQAAGNRSAATSLARIDAPFMQRVREAASGSRLSSDLSRIENQGQGQDFLSQLRMSLIQPNAGLNAAGDALIGYGSAAAQRAPKTKPVTKPRTMGPI